MITPPFPPTISNDSNEEKKYIYYIFFNKKNFNKKLHNLNCDETQIVMKLKNLNCEETQKLKL